MSIVADPFTKARAVTTLKQAARLHTDLEHELEHNSQAPGAWRGEAEQAVDMLEDLWGADELRDTATDAGYVPRLSRKAKGTVDSPHGGRRRSGAGGRSRSGGGSGGSSSTSKPSAGGRAGGGRSKSGRRSKRRPGRAGRRAWQRTGLPGAADSATGAVLTLVGATVGLVLLYAVVQGRGPRAVTIAGSSFVNALRMVISPTDPLAPAPAAAGRSGTRPFAGNAYERGVAAGELAGPPAPSSVLRQRRPSAPGTSPTSPRGRLP